VVNWQLAVGFISESHDKAQLNWSVCRCLQDVSKTAFLYQGFVSVFNMHLEYNRMEYKKSGHSSEMRTVNKLHLFAIPIFMH
jgi:hypothetical protein